MPTPRDAQQRGPVSSAPTTVATDRIVCVRACVVVGRRAAAYLRAVMCGVREIHQVCYGIAHCTPGSSPQQLASSLVGKRCRIAPFACGRSVRQVCRRQRAPKHRAAVMLLSQRAVYPLTPKKDEGLSRAA